MNIKNAKWKKDFSPVDPGMERYVSQEFSKAYARHLIMTGEILGMQLASIQNLAFYLWLMREARQAILEDRFESFKREILPRVDRRL
jgi:queuine tRNA-ribosyltransferase